MDDERRGTGGWGPANIVDAELTGNHYAAPSIEASPVTSTTNVSPTMATGSSANPAATGSVTAGTCSGSAPSVLPSQSVACVNGAWVVR